MSELSPWLNANWGVAPGDEQKSAEWEDLRRMVWAIDNFKWRGRNYLSEMQEDYAWDDNAHSNIGTGQNPQWVHYEAGSVVYYEGEVYVALYNIGGGDAHFDEFSMSWSEPMEPPYYREREGYKSGWGLMAYPTNYTHWIKNSGRFCGAHTTDNENPVVQGGAVQAHYFLPEDTNPSHQVQGPIDISNIQIGTHIQKKDTFVYDGKYYLCKKSYLIPKSQEDVDELILNLDLVNLASNEWFTRNDFKYDKPTPLFHRRKVVEFKPEHISYFIGDNLLVQPTIWKWFGSSWDSEWASPAYLAHGMIQAYKSFRSHTGLIPSVPAVGVLADLSIADAKRTPSYQASIENLCEAFDPIDVTQNPAIGINRHIAVSWATKFETGIWGFENPPTKTIDNMLDPFNCNASGFEWALKKAGIAVHWYLSINPPTSIADRNYDEDGMGYPYGFEATEGFPSPKWKACWRRTWRYTAYNFKEHPKYHWFLRPSDAPRPNPISCGCAACAHSPWICSTAVQNMIDNLAAQENYGLTAEQVETMEHHHNEELCGELLADCRKVMEALGIHGLAGIGPSFMTRTTLSNPGTYSYEPSDLGVQIVTEPPHGPLEAVQASVAAWNSAKGQVNATPSNDSSTGFSGWSSSGNPILGYSIDVRRQWDRFDHSYQDLYYSHLYTRHYVTFHHLKIMVSAEQLSGHILSQLSPDYKCKMEIEVKGNESNQCETQHGDTTQVYRTPSISGDGLPAVRGNFPLDAETIRQTGFNRAKNISAGQPYVQLHDPADSYDHITAPEEHAHDYDSAEDQPVPRAYTTVEFSPSSDLEIIVMTGPASIADAVLGAYYWDNQEFGAGNSHSQKTEVYAIMFVSATADVIPLEIDVYDIAAEYNPAFEFEADLPV